MSKVDFEKLKSKWYKKLEKSGFVDIEKDEDTLKTWSHKLVAHSGQYTSGAAERQTYYYMANQFLNSYGFKSERDKVIWEYHCEGISYRTISKKLKSRKCKPLSYNGIYLRVKLLSKIMFELYE